METTVEISMYPLKEGYEEPIIAFINHLKSCEGFEVRVNETATHLFGDFDAIFEGLRSGMKSAWQNHGKSVFVLKVLGANLKGTARDL
ncbi:MAG: hypothetical protein HQ500_09735 [Flavobacteriales bacterium]|nr:hypothetical protein [Flavobacteriales bacterium]